MFFRWVFFFIFQKRAFIVELAIGNLDNCIKKMF